MSHDEFDSLMQRVGYTDVYGKGMLNHWPSGKLFHPLDYWDIKRLVELVLADRDKPAQTVYDTREVDPNDRTTWMNAKKVP